MHDCSEADPNPIIADFVAAAVKSRLLLYVLALIVFCTFLYLGDWQLGRAQEKRMLLERWQSELADPLPDSMNHRSHLRIPMRVQVAGHFLPKIWLLDNQQHAQQVGVRIYQLFEYQQIEGPKRVLPVELGWLAYTDGRQLPEIGALEGKFELDGLLLSPPSAGIDMGQASQQVGADRWLMMRMQPELGEQQYPGIYQHTVLRPLPDWPHGFYRDLSILPNTLPPEKHQGYAVQWFAMAGAILFIVIVLSVRKK